MRINLTNLYSGHLLVAQMIINLMIARNQKEAIMADKNAGLYYQKVSLANTRIGSPTLFLNMTVYTPTGEVNGSGKITRALPPPEGILAIPQVKGGIYHTGTPVDQQLVHLTGEYVYSFPPPAIGSALMPITVAMSVDPRWKGKGSFTFGGRQVNDCVVTPLDGEIAAETQGISIPVTA
jgi:hypothetical protein